jgi:hypothetical protein
MGSSLIEGPWRKKELSEQSEHGLCFCKATPKRLAKPIAEQLSLSLQMIKPFNLIYNKLAAFLILSLL